MSPPRSPGDPGGDGIRVLIADDHAGLRAGLHALLTAEPGITPVGSHAMAAKPWHRIDVAESDVVVVDPDSGLADGLRLCFDVKNRVGGPSVVIYSAYADRFLGAPARIAQADALVSKAAPVSELLEAIRLAATGTATGPGVALDVMVAVSARLAQEDLPLVQMLLSRMSLHEIADELVWSMVGIALWHFAIFVPDRFWGGIIGAFLAALGGALAAGYLPPTPGVPTENPPGIEADLYPMPGSILGLVASYFYGARLERHYDLGE